MIFTNEDLEQIPFTSKKYANQKSMYIHKAAVDKDHIYSLISQEAHMKALNDFGWSAAYNLWVYLCCNQDGYIENFSPTHIGQLAHKDRRTIQRAVKELEDKGYLFQVAENDYIFFENPNDNGCDTSATSLGCSTSVTSLNINKEENLDKKGCDIDATGGATSVSQGATLVLQECDTGVYSNIINNIDNINNNIEFSPHDLSTKVENHCEENLLYEDDVITKCNNGENDNMDNSVHIDKVVHMDNVVQVGSSSAYVLSKDELRPIHTSDGAVVELPIRNILDGLKDALTNKKNESTIKEIREKCDLTEKQKKEIDDTLDFWELDW